MNKILITCILMTLNLLYAKTNTAYINITSNVENTVIILNGKEIGKTPIKQFKVTPEKLLNLKAIANKDYYQEDIIKNFKVEENNIPTINLKFTKSIAEIFLLGDNAELYINDKFIKKLHDSNRLTTLEADNNVTIRLENHDAKTILNKDIKANKLTTIKYKLVTIPLEIRLYTSSINYLMWEDTKEAVNTNITWEKARLYCSSLQIAHYDDFRLPTIEELNDLYENKDKIYNGYGGKFYWSQSTYKGKNNVWDYSQVKNFEDGLDQKSIKEFTEGRVRCVRDLNTNKDKNNEEDL